MVQIQNDMLEYEYGYLFFTTGYVSAIDIYYISTIDIDLIFVMRIWILTDIDCPNSDTSPPAHLQVTNETHMSDDPCQYYNPSRTPT